MRRVAVLAALGLGLATPAMPQGLAASLFSPSSASLEAFRTAALQADAFGTETSRLALERSRNPAIRAYARRMMQDHARTTQALRSTASASSAPVVLSARQAGTLGQLSSESGQAFDALYLQAQTTLHQETAELYAAYAQGGTDPAMRAFAQGTLPDVQGHLRAAQRLVGGRGHGATR